MLLFLLLTVSAVIHHDCRETDLSTDECCQHDRFDEWIDRQVPEHLRQHFDRSKYLSREAIPSANGAIVASAQPFGTFLRHIYFNCYYSVPESRIELEYARRGHRGPWTLTCVSPRHVTTEDVPRPREEAVWSSGSESSGSEDDDDPIDRRGYCRPFNHSGLGDLKTALRQFERRLMELEAALSETFAISEVTDMTELVHDLRQLVVLQERLPRRFAMTDATGVEEISRDLEELMRLRGESSGQ